MRFGLVVSNIGSFAEPKTVLDVAERAEKAGWEALLVWDHLAWVWARNVELGGANRFSRPRPLDPWTMLAAVAVRSERLLLGTCVTPVPRRRPQVLALQVATLDELSGGRAIFGAGLGGNRREFEEFGESFDTERRWQLLEDGLRLMRELWSGPLGPREVPIWVGGNSGRAQRLAAAYDGWLPDTTSPDEMTMAPKDLEGATASEIVVMGYSSPGQRELHDAYAAAGATWWLESLHDRRAGLESLLARIAAGP